jgi:autotransporter translocation and assembly factor TamB
VNADYHVAGTPDSMRGDARFADSTIPGASIASGSTAGFALRGRQIDYRADATVNDVDLERVGEAFDVRALAAERYKSRINAHIVASGSGTTPKEMSLTANGTLTDSSVMGGRIPELTFDASVADDTAHVVANGAFADLDPAVASGRPDMIGNVGGTFDVDATVEGFSAGVTPDNVVATARMTVDPSKIGGLAIDRGRLDADYRQQTGNIRQLEIAGRDINVTAKGTLALNDTGQSNLTVHADTPSLEELGKLAGIPLTGIAKVDGTITGNRSELQATGTVVGDGVKYQENGALTMTSDYSARVPDLAFDRASVDADTRATFVTVAGQNINELTAKTTYADKQVTFDLTARQPQRALGAAGSVLLHPEHQEVHLQSLSLDTAGQQWTLAPGTEATVRYAQDAIAVTDLRLVSRDQGIVADGTFGKPGDVLKVTLNNVDLASVNALMLRPPQFGGRLNASSTISGTKASPAIKGGFQVTQGNFRQFRYESFGGTVDYAGKGVTLDARLQESPTQWINAKGYLPVALFSSSGAAAPEPSAASHEHAEPATPADRVDLTIDSSPLDLGLVQGFTTVVTNVKGTLEAHVRVTGSAADPHPSGSISVRNGAMLVEPTGVNYTNIAGTIDLQADRVHVDQFTVLDNHQSALSVTGDLAVHERQVGGVQLWVVADDFKIIDNKMGNIRMQSAMEITGELRAPIVRGDVGVSTGSVNLDEIIALTGTSAYATKPTEFSSEVADTNGQTPTPSGFEALRMNLRLTVPNDLVIKANNLQTPGSPLGLGALNVTVGGDLIAQKDPGSSVRLTGNVNTVRGTYDFQGRRFEILRDGTIRFEGLDELNPSLDIRARRLIQAVEARVNIRGTLKQPEIVLSSTPPLEEADILALIVFNQPLNQLGEGQQISLAQRAEAIAAGAVVSQLAQSIGNALSLDTFEINLAPENGGGPEVTVGQQVGRNLYVKVQQGFGDQNTTNLVLEYEITNWLRLQTNVVQGSTQSSLFRRQQSTGADLIFFFSY